MIAALQTADRATLLTWTRILVFVIVVLGTLTPFNAPILVFGGFVLQAFWIARDHGDLWQRLRAATISRGWIALAVFFAYLAVRLFELPIAEDALPGLASMGLIGLFTFATLALMPHQNEDVQSAIALAFIAAFAAASAVHAIELTSGFALRRKLWTWVPLLRPRSWKVILDGDQVRDVVVFIANPTSTALAALFWPVLLLYGRVAKSRAQQGLIAAGVVLCIYAIFRSDQATSKMALLAGAVTWAIVTYVPRSARPLLAAIWIGSNLLVLPLALTAYLNEAYKLPRTFSAQHRVVIWGVTAEKTLEHPWFGIGTGKTNDYDESTSPDVKSIPGTRIPIATNRHAHNVFLQLWYEDGAVGVLLFVFAGLPVIGWIASAPQRHQALLAAAFSATVVSASLSYSLFAAWFLATFAITALFCRFAVNFEPQWQSQT